MDKVQVILDWLSTNWAVLVPTITLVVSFLSAVIGLIVSCYKLKKLKALSNEELAEATSQAINEKLSEQIESLKTELSAKVEELTKSVNTLQKITALSQNKTKEGKIDLLNFLFSESQNAEVKEVAKETKIEIEEEQKAE